MSFIPHILAGDSITVLVDGVHIFPKTHLKYNDICDSVRTNDLEKLKKVISKKVSKEGLEILENEILWNGEPLHTVAVQRLFEAKRNGFDISHIIKFLENCQKNDHPKVVERLYEFLESRGMPITEDGCFIAYKYTNENYWDKHTGKTYRFIPGTHIRANNIKNRKTICDLSGEECSGEGIHVGNWEYSGSASTVFYVKVNPKDVLSVPHGDSAKKIRVWELDVLDRTNGQILDEVVVDKKGKTSEFKVNQRLSIRYKAKRNKEIVIVGNVRSVGNKYLELKDWFHYDVNESTLNTNVCISSQTLTPNIFRPRRIQISNILEVL